MNTGARWLSHVLVALLLFVAMHAQSTLDGGDYDRYFSPNTLTLNGGECKSSPSTYDCDFISVSDGIKDTRWTYALIRIPTRNGSFSNGCFNLRDNVHPDLYMAAEPCATGRWPLVGHADADTIRGRIQFVTGHVILVELNIKYTRKHGKRVPYIAPGSTVISR